VIIVPDAGPLIYLAGAGHLELLRTLYAEVAVPRIVVDEIVIAGAGLTGRSPRQRGSGSRKSPPTPTSSVCSIQVKPRPSRSPTAFARLCSQTTRTPGLSRRNEASP
jgi:hypothetical protein